IAVGWCGRRSRGCRSALLDRRTLLNGMSFDPTLNVRREVRVRSGCAVRLLVSFGRLHLVRPEHGCSRKCRLSLAPRHSQETESDACGKTVEAEVISRDDCQEA